MKRTVCRGCGHAGLQLVHDFGAQPLAGFFPPVPEKDRPAPRYPLELAACGACTLLQVTTLPPIEEVFHADYRYSSSTIPALNRHFDEYGAWLAAKVAPGARILEFGCNDGILLERLARRGFACHGVDASLNMVEAARAKGLTVDHAFFCVGHVTAAGLAGQFDLVTCSNVYAHVDDLRDLTRAAWLALADGGRFAIEVHDGDGLAASRQFDTVYHEHQSYFTARSISAHLAGNGFSVERIERTAMHGGGLRILARRSASFESLVPAVADGTGWIDDLGQVLRQGMQGAAAAIDGLATRHGALWAYGAAGRSQMFLNFTRTADRFTAVFDDSPLRQDRYIAATNLPIRKFDAAPRAGACVILAWNYADDIAARIRDRFEAVYTVLPELRRW